MGRVAEKQSYQTKNTCMELVPAEDELEFQRNQRTLSDTAPDSRSPALQMLRSPYQCPQTPSPFYAAQPDPSIACFPPFALDAIPGGAAQPGLSFGDFGIDDGSCQGQQIYNCGEANGNYVPSFQYDPNTGTYMAYDYGNCYMPYDPNCYGMTPYVQEQVQDERNPEEHTQALLSALSEKLSEDQIQDIAASGNMDGWKEQDCWEGSAWGRDGNSWHGGAEDQQQVGVDSQQQQQLPGRRRAERREAREAARRQERPAVSAMGGDMQDDSHGHGHSRGGSQWNAEISGQESRGGKGGSSGNITTVMLRNIPNKYTREMLVKQLEHDMRAQFDFIYLPIDFKNKCNVGYAFINFRTVDACDMFVEMFNGVEVRKCLPGLNSRKITEVTPARVQGFTDNVQRLRNSPVMRELVHKPEWMPLIFDACGEQTPFPNPERPLDPIKPRRRARDED